MANKIRIEKQTAGETGRYVARIDGVAGEAELAFTVRGPRLVSADHTEAPESMRGAGAAMALIEHMIAAARADGFKIVPICPYVRAQLRKHPEWRDVMADAPSRYKRAPAARVPSPRPGGRHQAQCQAPQGPLQQWRTGPP
jgi:predicted GNAT family acetyltransferase